MQVIIFLILNLKSMRLLGALLHEHNLLLLRVETKNNNIILGEDERIYHVVLCTIT